MAAGQKVSLSIRSECVALDQINDAGAPVDGLSIVGTYDESVYLGLTTSHLARLPDGTEMVSRVIAGSRRYIARSWRACASALESLRYPSARGVDPMPSNPRIPFQLSSDRAPLTGPEGKQLIVHIVMNIEYWPIERAMPRGIIPAPHGATPAPPDVPNFSWVEYGMRCGMPRILDMLAREGIALLGFSERAGGGCIPGTRWMRCRRQSGNWSVTAGSSNR